MQFLNHLSLCI